MLGSPEINLRNKKILYIDPQRSFYDIIRQMLFGENVSVDKRGNSIDWARNWSEAMTKVQSVRTQVRNTLDNDLSENIQTFEGGYDVIFCEYDIDKEKTAQDFLDTVRKNHLIGLGTIFVMIASENKRQKVISVLEYAPDAYIMKDKKSPAELERRIIRALKDRNELLHIYKAIDEKEYGKALILCNDYITAERRLSRHVLKLTGFISLELKAYEDAKRIYTHIQTIEREEARAEGRDEKMVGYATRGRAEAMYHLGEKEEAIKTLEALQVEHPDYMEAYDTLAGMLQGVGRVDDAVKTLKAATDRSPGQWRRQQELGVLALNTGHLDIAEGAFKALTTEGRFSVSSSPENFANLATIELEKPDANLESVLATLRNSLKTFRKTDAADVAKFSAAVVSTEVHTKRGDTVRAAQSQAEAEQLYSKGVLDDETINSPVVIMKFAGQCIDAGKNELARHAVTKITEQSKHGAALSKLADRILGEKQKAAFTEMHTEASAALTNTLADITDMFRAGGDSRMRAIRNVSKMAKLSPNADTIFKAAELYLMDIYPNKIQELLKTDGLEDQKKKRRQIQVQFDMAADWYSEIMLKHGNINDGKKRMLETLYTRIKKKCEEHEIGVDTKNIHK